MSNRTIAHISRQIDCDAWKRIRERHRRQAARREMWKRIAANGILVVGVAAFIAAGVVLAVVGVANGAVW